MRYNFARYNKGEGVVKIVMEDESGKKLQTFRANQSDKISQSIIGNALKEKWGVDLTPTTKKEFKDEGIFDF